MAGIDVRIKDGTGDSFGAKVSSIGEVIVCPFAYSDSYNATAAVINTAYNLVPPMTGNRFVITAINLYANQGVSNTSDATVTLYEATGTTITTVSKNIFVANMVRQDTITLTGINLILSEGKWLNIKTTDNTVIATILGYYIPA